MIIFITGGAKNGKSSLAQDLTVHLSGNQPHYYVATMIPSDQEDLNRIQRHIDDRAGMGFLTLECGRDILNCLGPQVERSGSFLLDSVTALLLNELFPDPTSCHMDIDAANKCGEDLIALACSVSNIVLVSDYIYSDAAIYDEVTETYRRCLASIDRELAKIADCVIEVSMGNIIIHKGVCPL